MYICTTPLSIPLFMAHFVFSSIDRHLDCFYLLAIVTVALATMNMGGQISLQDPNFNSFG